MATDKPSAAAGAIATLDQSLELAAANAVAAQQQVAVIRQAAVTAAASVMVALFTEGGEAGTEKIASPSGSAAELAAAAEAGAESAAAGGVAFPRAAGFSAALAAIDAENVLASVGTLSTLLATLALARYVATGDERFLEAQKAADAMLLAATARYERICSYAASLGSGPAAA